MGWRATRGSAGRGVWTDRRTAGKRRDGCHGACDTDEARPRFAPALVWGAAAPAAPHSSQLMPSSIPLKHPAASARSAALPWADGASADVIPEARRRCPRAAGRPGAGLRLAAVAAGCLGLVTFAVAAPAPVAPGGPPAPAWPARTAPAVGPAVRRGLRLPQIPVHDPWILADRRTHTYYLYSSASPRITGVNRTGTLFYKSHDLVSWNGPYVAFICPSDCWADPRQAAWAPEVHAYRGRYYLLTTLHNPERPLPTSDASRPNLMRSTVIAVSGSPEGPFTLLKKDTPVAPANFMTLDGTLYVDRAGRPWMVYAHEWVQKVDGTIEALPLTPDLASAAGAPIFLFKGSDAPWLDAQMVPNAKENHYVTDGPELYRTKDGHLLMLWSSYERNRFGRDGYVETLARSKSGRLRGPWEQLPPLVRNDSGHGMLFHSFDGKLLLVLHQPFLNARAKIYEMADLGDTLRVVRYRADLSGPPLGPQLGQKPR